MGIRVDAEENLKWRLNWNQILSVDSTIGFLVKLEGLMGNADVSKAGSVEEKHDWVSSLHHNRSGE
jgi:hypothetical protein